jgi:hypothetical protein
MQARPWVRLAYSTHDRLRGTWGSTCVIAGIALLSLLAVAPPRNRRARMVAVAQHENARRQIARIASSIRPAECGLVRTGMGALGRETWAALGAILREGRVRKRLRTIRAIDSRHGFLVSCRAAIAIAWYARGRAILDAHRPGAVLVSSDSNPEEVGFAAAARALGIPQVFVSHAYPTPFTPPLDFTLSILEGEAALRMRRHKGVVKGEVVFSGLEGESAPLDPWRFERSNPVIGVFTPKAICWPTLAAIIDDCRRHFHARAVIIRWHPSMFERSRLDEFVDDRSGVVESPRTAALAEVAARCDWVVADENSNVHLPVLKLGIPTIAVRNLGLYPPSRSDLYGFAANGIVFPGLRSLRDVRPDALVAFFSGSWADRFEQYDASYYRPRAAIDREVQQAICALFDGSASQATVA